MSTSGIEEKVKARRALPPPRVRRAIREAAQVSQEDEARELGVTRATISRWESGDREPRGEHLVRYAGLLERLQELVR